MNRVVARASRLCEPKQKHTGETSVPLRPRRFMVGMRFENHGGCTGNGHRILRQGGVEVAEDWDLACPCKTVVRRAARR